MPAHRAAKHWDHRRASHQRHPGNDLLGCVARIAKKRKTTISQLIVEIDQRGDEKAAPTFQRDPRIRAAIGRNGRRRRIASPFIHSGIWLPDRRGIVRRRAE